MKISGYLFAAAVLTAAAFAVSCSGEKEPVSFTMATYNIRYDNKDDSLDGNGWKARLPKIAALAKFHGFEIFGTQEGLYHQLEGLKAALPGFDYTGIGRDDGVHGGEHSAIFYDTRRFELLDHGDFWLSEITDRPNKGWDAVLPRICSWGKFRIRGTDFVFKYYNLHMDHIGVRARQESARLVMKKISENPEKLPAVLSGDFNIPQDDEGIRMIDSSGILNDIFRTADITYQEQGTFNDFDLPSESPDERIDHIFTTADFHVRKAGVLTDSYWSETIDGNGEKTLKARTPSDHFPIVAVLEIKR